jgi:hypothetical protein
MMDEKDDDDDDDDANAAAVAAPRLNNRWVVGKRRYLIFFIKIQQDTCIANAN